jgi:hypothetical protein
MSVSPVVMGSPTWSLFWGTTPGAYSMLGNESPTERGISRVFARQNERVAKRIILTLLGAAVGGTATETFAQISAPAGLTQASQLGGLRTVDTVTAVNRVTNANDLSYTQSLVQRMINTPTIANYAVDASGNGGGGKAGF